ncbi:MBL fold metallo-hydrolase [Halococcus salifodinae]|uniref:Flavodoxin/nitric oxide synthase n=2 Tax=Halococcus salifodinae TaxID=36738 RepID=M0NCD0_9EURY|nr:MBL fold metallo-hydrolase [Halococcus salifodinae]EMA54759.1 flavodoxin/nitric oxide synthase [Halococcus salifodinae DSM 8989]
MGREVLPGLHWFYEPGPDRLEMVTDGRSAPDWYEPGSAVRIPQCSYLFDGERSLLFDTLSPASREQILADLDDALDGGSLDYLVVSHPDVPHAGNASAILDEYDDITLVAPRYGNAHDLYHLDEAMHIGEGDEIDLGRFTVAFHEATFLDAPISLWMTERTHEMLLPVDWMGFPHHDADRLTCVDELDYDLTLDQLVEFHGRVLFWHQYVNVEKVQREIRQVVETYDPELVLPTHGLVIRERTTEYLELMTDVVAEIERRDRVGALGG